ncbi:hypothetical protein TrST_g10320 [Triparma strigata]|uniref:BspA family leucine-rich repeat surface protein n=1 Tax=Triparma strigata TaxID=1606541 RepID=A0A9W7EV09_9STRA|nr:hypothetical protein TrST_g10320 [Triparma strigata]
MKDFLLLLIILVATRVCFSDASTICTSASPISSCISLTDSNFQITVDAYLDEANEADAIATYGDMRYWYTGDITSMASAFASRKEFNLDISAWNVSEVTNMDSMFL